MGSYFSLHDSAFWEQTLRDAPEPSIWSNVDFSPLALNQRLLLERPGRVYSSFASGLRQGGSSVQFSEASEVSLIVGFDESAGRLYSAVLLKAAELSPHRYGRELEEVVLSHPAARGLPENSMMSDGGSPNATRRPQQSQQLEMDKLGAEGALQQTEWPYVLMYAVKEGVLLFFTEDPSECMDIVRNIAVSFGDKGPVPQDLAMSAGRAASTGMGGGTAAAANLAAALKVKCVEHFVGRGPPAATKLITDLIMGDLQRDFAVRCEPEIQPYSTNCVVFCVRVVMALQLAVRGYDIRTICESQEQKNVLGPKAGEAACAAWEKLWKHVRP